jgi:hypothetical protein
VGIFDSQIDQAVDKAFAKQLENLANSTAALQVQITELKGERDALKRVKSLQEQISRLEIDKAKIVEDNDRKIRETTHMVGLERKRQEFEAEQAKKGIEHARKEAILEVQAENLETERAAFVKEMKFREERFTQEVGYLKDLMTQILDRLPTVTVDRQITETTKKTV